jgi:hypothetical protein
LVRIRPSDHQRALTPSDLARDVIMSGVPEHPRSVRVVFADPEEAYLAIYRLRAAGFRIDVSGSSSGDVVVMVQAEPSQLEQLTTIASEHEGRTDAWDAATG